MARSNTFILSLLLALLLCSPTSHGKLYKWVDENGDVHYGDSPPENANLKRITGKVSSFSKVSVEPFVYDPSNVTERKKSTKVVMYSTSWCGYCKKASLYFEKKGIPFVEHDIERSPKAAKEYKALKGRGVPVILIGERRMNGFEANTFQKIYDEQS